jgi:hypothetical protein
MDMTIPQHNNLNAYDLLKVIDIIQDEAKYKFLGEHCTSQVTNVIASWAHIDCIKCFLVQKDVYFLNASQDMEQLN